MAGATELASARLTLIPTLKGAEAAINAGLATSSVKGAATSAGDNVGKTFGGSFKNSMSSFMKTAAVAGLTTMGARAAKDFVADSVQTGREFDASMAQVAATMGVSVDSIQDLRDFAREMGAETAFSATQASEALNYMALAGYDSEKSMKMLPQVLNLAAAGGIDLAYASDMVTDASSALGLTMEQTETLVNQMAKASSKTNTSVAQLGEGILTVGGTAKVLSGGTTEVAQALGILADNGVKGSEGGTALRNILLRLSSPTDKAALILQNLGVKVFDAEGRMRSLKDVMGDLNGAMADMSDEERTQTLANIFNKVDLKSVNAMLGTSTERWDELSSAIGNAGNAADEMAKTQLDNLEGDMTIMDSALSDLKISISDALNPALREIIQGITEGLGGMGDALSGVDPEAMREFGRSIGDAFREGLPMVVDFTKSVIENWPTIVATVKSLAAGFITMKAGMAISGIVQSLSGALNVVRTAMQGAAVGQTALNTAMKANIFIAIASLVMTLITYLVDLYNHNEEFRNAVNGFAGEVMNFIGGVVDWFKALPEHLSNAIGAIGEFFAGIGQWFSEKIAGIVDWFKNLPTTIEEAFKGLVNIITFPFRTAFNAIAGFWNDTIGQLSWTAPDWVPGIGGQTIGAPKLPILGELADGAIAKSATQAIIGEGTDPEALLPLNERGAAFARSIFGGSDASAADIEGAIERGMSRMSFNINGRPMAKATRDDYNRSNGAARIYSKRGMAYA